MSTESLEQQLEKWKRVLLLLAGVGLTLAISMVGFERPYTFSLGWITIWLVLELGAIPAGLLIFFGKEWRQLPLTQRLNTAFGFLGAAWLGWLAVGLWVYSESSSLGGSFTRLAFVLLIGAVLAISYLLQRRAHTSSPEDIFP